MQGMQGIPIGIQGMPGMPAMQGGQRPQGIQMMPGMGMGGMPIQGMIPMMQPPTGKKEEPKAVGGQMPKGVPIMIPMQGGKGQQGMGIPISALQGMPPNMMQGMMPGMPGMMPGQIQGMPGMVQGMPNMMLPGGQQGVPVMMGPNGMMMMQQMPKQENKSTSGSQENLQMFPMPEQQGFMPQMPFMMPENKEKAEKK